MKFKNINWSGRLDVMQSGTGVLLTLFLWTHVILVSSILLGGKAMSWVAGVMELKFMTDDGHGYPWVVTLIAIVIGVLALMHMLAVMHKMPLNLKQQLALRNQLNVINHADTRLWVWQAITGVIIMVALPVHLWLIGSAPETIGPVGSAIRIWRDHAWLLYFPLLFAAEMHAAIGIYRVALKWGAVRDLNTRVRIKKIKNIISVVFVAIGTASILAFLPHVSA
ncbi:putative fumarate reductase cytochrome b subunit frdC [Moritella yayanosii]|uniref:Putative fumarate reductase cytochrome b subunit frdC n=2 Tax=Moritella yayanosii TaxID=69539 RepID=A0A330LQB9_9GAMM|nr:putative fumarate reductase cytochrome b subunit frdC [Moritella yayanosii]